MVNKKCRVLIVIACTAILLGLGGGIFLFLHRTSYCETVLFQSYNNVHYRIPCITVSKSGTLIAFASKRTSLDDWTKDISLVYRTSVDGQTWSEERTLVQSDGLTNNNPVIIADNDGCLHFIYCVEYGLEENNGGIYYMRSQDDGLTWTPPRDISENTLQDYRNAFATGPGHGICLSDGTLMVPVWMVPKEYGQDIQSHKPSVISTFYSKDHGETWQVGEIIEGSEDGVYTPSEGTILERTYGDVLLNVRNAGKEKRRAYTTSSDGITGWSALDFNIWMPDPICFGSLARYDDSTILFANALDTKERKNNAVSISYNEGRTFERHKIIRTETGGYSDICVDNHHIIHVAVEWPDEEGYYSISLYSFNMNWLME